MGIPKGIEMDPEDHVLESLGTPTVGILLFPKERKRTEPRDPCYFQRGNKREPRDP